MRCFEKFVLTVVKMIFSSVEGKRTRTGRNLKEFVFLIETVLELRQFLEICFDCS